MLQTPWPPKQVFESTTFNLEEENIACKMTERDITLNKEQRQLILIKPAIHNGKQPTWRVSGQRHQRVKMFTALQKSKSQHRR